MDIIHLLPDSVANQIAAGEVIQRPASCLKELVENSLDAGAKTIHVIVRDAGRTLLQVTDDGKGMSATDARMAFERHATSKIAKAEDLFALHTMGFRGEALASIAAVAQVEVLTRRAEDEVGTLVEISGSEVVRHEPAQTAVGTSMKVKNLFFNVPARRRFLKTDATELRNLINCFYRIVLVYPDVHFVLVSDDELLYDLPKSSLKQRIEAVFGRTMRNGIASRLVDVNADTAAVRIFGYIGKPEDAQKQAQQYFFVNGRYMKHPYFHKAVMSAYAGMLAPDHNPYYFLYFDIEPDAIDINIHPTKTEIKFADEQMIWQIVLAAVRESLGKFNVTPSIDFDREGEIEMPQAGSGRGDAKMPQVSINSSYNPFKRAETNYVPGNWQQLYPSAEEQQQETAESEQRLFAPDLSQATPYQYKERYILLPVETGLLTVDQHLAHTAVLYKHFRKQQADKQGVKQQVLFPEVLDLNAADATLLVQIQEELEYVGFEICQLAPNSFSVDAVPAELGGGNPLRTLIGILHELQETGGSTRETWEQRIALSLAEDAAIKRGKVLQESEMRDLLDRLFALENYQYTPGGKRICSIISDEEMERKMK